MMALHHAVLLSLALSSATAARFELSAAFGDNMVLQRGVPVSIWGWATGFGLNVTIYGALFNRVSNSSILVNSSSDAVSGAFTLTFPAQLGGVSTSYDIVVSTSPITPLCPIYAYHCGGATIPINNVLFGDVLFCHGQSNMQVNVAFAFNATAELAASNALGGLVRVFQVEPSILSIGQALDNIARIQTPWSPASNVSLPSFSATCWYTAKAIVEGRKPVDSNIPLGLIASTWGGTAIKAWTSAAVGAQCDALYPSPAPDCGLLHAPCNQSVLYNAMVAPFTVGPTRVAAFVWFQGENDASVTELEYYACQLRAQIADLRASFASPAAHWTTVQLAPYTGGSALGPFRDMQCNTTWVVPNADCAVIDDDGDPLSPIGNVHSRNKQLVGRRVAVGILNSVYGYGLQATGPRYAAAVVATSGASLYANVSFTPASLGNGGSLVYVPPHVDPWQNSSRCPTEIGITLADCEWVYILGSNGQLYNATVAISADGTQLELACEACAPAGVTAIGTRFGYNAWPVVNVYNADGYPMVPWNETAL